MELLKLSSNNPKFKTLDFNPNLNIVAGLQLTDEDRLTINGIGKSLTLILIHLMFGSKFDPKKMKEKKLKRYLENYGVFYLNFKHNDCEYEIKKDFSKPEFYINDEKISQKDYSNTLSNILLGEMSEISFKQFFNSCARRFGGDYYSDLLRQQGQPLTDYYQRFVNLKLLHIETDLVKQKFEIEDQIAKLNKAVSVIREYQEALDKANLKDLKDEYKTLQTDKNNFIIAENHDSIKRDADELTKELNELRNSIQKNNDLTQKKLQNIADSDNIDIDPNIIENLYNEAKFFFDNKVKKRLEEAKLFHNKLIINRKNRIELEVKELEIEKKELVIKYNQITNKRDEILRLLNKSGALEEYNSIIEKINFLNNQIRTLTKYEETLSDFKRDKSNLNVQRALIKEKSILYIEKEKKYLEEIEDTFRTIVKQFYDNHGGSLKLKEAEKARYLYNINIEIPRSSSQAIGEVEIFCYDVLLYNLNKNTLNFLAHDGCIFSEMDPRQKSMIFKIIIDLINKNNLQYFINIGDSSLKEILNQKILSKEEKAYIEKNIILELYDKNPKNWLFGESFD